VIEHIGRLRKYPALIVPKTLREAGIQFRTADDLTPQLAYMRHSAGKVIECHLIQSAATIALKRVSGNHKEFLSFPGPV
jgi:hypothetical protein